MDIKKELNAMMDITLKPEFELAINEVIEKSYKADIEKLGPGMAGLVKSQWEKMKPCLFFAYCLGAKAQAVPEGFVLIKSPISTEMQTVGKQALGLGMFGCDLQDAVDAMIEAQEQKQSFKVGDLVEPKDYRYTFASGACRYPHAFVVNTDPFQLMSEEGDMYWSCTVEASGYKLLKSNVQLPAAVSLRMIREGLLSQNEAKEQSHD